MNNNISILGKNIKILREKRRWSLNKLKTESDVGYATLHDLENGKSRSLTSVNLEKVAKALNVNTMTLLDEKEIETSEIKDINELIMFTKENNFIIDNINLNDFEKYLIINSLENTINIIKYGRNKK